MPNASPRMPHAACRVPHAPAFTLIETALTTVIIGVGVLALIESQQAFMRSNGWSTQAATATYLANEVRELTRTLPRHDPVTGLYIADSGGGPTLFGWGPEAGETSLADLDDIDDFDGLTFSFQGTAGLDDNDLPGPIDGFGATIPEILADGSVMLDAEGGPMPLQGWSQEVTVEKLDPFDTATVRAAGFDLPPVPPDFDGLAVDAFPLRVTVNVRFQGLFENEPREIIRVVWIVP